MARARNLKPGFFKNEDLAECSAWARLCFAGLWTLADREGRLEDRPKRIKGELFAFDSIEVEPLLVELAGRGFIHRYRAEDGRGLIQVVAFHKHQNPHHREPASDLPPPMSPRLDGHDNTNEPEADAPCNAPEAQGQPGAGPGLDPPKDDLASGSGRAESGYSDSGTLIPEEGTSAPAPRKRGLPPQNRVERPDDVDTQVWDDWLALRKAKKAPVTLTVLDEAKAQAAKAGMPLEAFLRVWCRRGTTGLEAAWLKPHERPANGRSEPEWRTAERERMEQAAGRYAARPAGQRPATTTNPAQQEILDAADPLG